ncbi:MAG TPA: SAM-dependent methyltransferase, partial [Tenericutes bacterium]|nr:SAM-dependent methyltransferase [Mycoplasmatota bacterium]
MNLSKRLLEIANIVDRDSTVIDIGCDHGLLDIYLSLYKNCKCIASDISEKCVKKTLENIKKYNVGNKVDVILSDGLQKIQVHNDDIIIISGMGTRNILNILTNLKTNNRLIISSHNDLDILRKKICKKGYYIFNEIAITDKNIDYVIIDFRPGTRNYNFLQYKYGPVLIKNKKYEFYFENIIKKNIV